MVLRESSNRQTCGLWKGSRAIRKPGPRTACQIRFGETENRVRWQVVPGARIELATPAFSGRRSTNELPRHKSLRNCRGDAKLCQFEGESSAHYRSDSSNSF